MPVARNINDTKDYELDRERGKPDSTLFELGPCRSANAEARAADLLRTDRLSEGCDEVLAAGGLRGWRRFIDDAGREVKFRGKGGATQDDLLRLTLKDRTELAAQVIQNNALTGAESD